MAGVPAQHGRGGPPDHHLWESGVCQRGEDGVSGGTGVSKDRGPPAHLQDRHAVPERLLTGTTTHTRPPAYCRNNRMPLESVLSAAAVSVQVVPRE